MERLLKAEKPSKKEKQIRKVAMWIMIDLVALAFAFSLFQEALASSYTVVIERSEAREKVDQSLQRLTTQETPQTDDRGVVVEEGAKTPVTALATIKKVAEEEGVDWKIIYAICRKETGCNPNIDCSKQGGHCDNGNSFGAYQINRPAHPDLAIGDMEDFEWGTRWTAQRIKTKADRWGIDLAIALHNGNPKLPQVQKYLADVKSIIATL